MRHTRNRQLFKLTGHPHWKTTYTVPIWMNLKWMPLGLDTSFKWHRDWYMSKEVNLLVWDNIDKPLGLTYHFSKGKGIF